VIEDDHAWAHYYAGQVLREASPPGIPSGLYPNCFFVISRASERREPVTPRKYAESTIAGWGARIVYHWPPEASPGEARVVVYHLINRKSLQ
jgi:hypothetical protein